MEDVELVLRFFALRHYEKFRGNLEKFLDLYMIKSTNFSLEDIQFLEKIFLDTLKLGVEIYGEHLFKPYVCDKSKNWTWSNQPYKAYYDAVMVGLSKYLSYDKILKGKKIRLLKQHRNY